MPSVTDVLLAAVIGAVAGLGGAFIVARQQGRSARAERRVDSYIEVLAACHALKDSVAPLFHDVPETWEVDQVLKSVHSVELARARIAVLGAGKLRRRWRELAAASSDFTDALNPDPPMR